MNEYSTIFKYNIDSNGNPISIQSQETKQVSPLHKSIQLDGIPDELNRVVVINSENQMQMTEVFNIDDITSENLYYVDYNQGLIYFHKDQSAKTKILNYYSKGLELISTNRIYYQHNVGGETVVELLEDIIKIGWQAIESMKIYGELVEIFELLKNTISEARDVDSMLHNTISEAQDVDRAINNATILIQVSDWTKITNGEYTGFYSCNKNHGLNSMNLIVQCWSDSVSQSLTGIKMTNDNNIEFINDTPITVKAVFSKSYYAQSGIVQLSTFNTSQLPQTTDYRFVSDNELYYIRTIPDLTKKVNNSISHLSTEDYDNLQSAINDAMSKNATLEFKPKTYDLTEQLTIDLSKCSIKGNGAILNFSKGANDLVCIKLTGSGINPYRNNGHFFKEFEIVGSGMYGNQTAIKFESNSANTATSHLDLEKLNIHEFGLGLSYKTFCYLIRHYSVDVYNCTTCIDMPAGGNDYGENINFYGCAFYNSETAIKGANNDGSFHFTSCSVDYCNNFFNVSDMQRCFFINGHIEGHGIIKGNINVDNSWLVLSRADGNIFDVTNGEVINISNCFINTQLFEKQLANGSGRVSFNNCRHYTTSDFTTNYLNDNSAIYPPKAIDLYAIGGTGDNVDKLTRQNCVVTRDEQTFETDGFSWKISKQYGVGSTCEFRALFKRNVKNSRVHLRVRVKSDTTISTSSSDFNVRLLSLSNGQNSVGMPYLLDYSNVGNHKKTITPAWQWLDFYTNTTPLNEKYEYLALDCNLFMWNGVGNAIYIDRILMFEY